MNPFWKGWLFVVIGVYVARRLLGNYSEWSRKRCAAEAYHGNYRKAARYSYASGLAILVATLCELGLVVCACIVAFKLVMAV